MAGILRTVQITAGDWYANLVSAVDGKFANGTLLEVYDSNNDGDYRINFTQVGSKGIYTAPFPGVPAGLYIVLIYQDGVADPQGSYLINWDGTSEVVPAGANATRDAILDATITPPAAAPTSYTLRSIMAWLLAITKFKRTQTSSTETVFADDGTTPVATSAKTVSSGTLTRGEYS